MPGSQDRPPDTPLAEIDLATSEPASKSFRKSRSAGARDEV